MTGRSAFAAGRPGKHITALALGPPQRTGIVATSQGVRCKRMFKIPENIDLEVVKLMEEADWPWDPLHRAFRQAARANEPFAST